MNYPRIGCALVLAACGGGGGVGGGFDGGPPDGVAFDSALVDASPDAGPTRIRVLVNNMGVPSVGVPVLFQRPDDTLIVAKQTDDNGVVEVDLREGGNVTALPPAQGGALGVFTYLGAKGGDVLEIGGQTFPEIPPSERVTLQLPPAAGTYHVRMRCNSVSSTTRTVMLTTCGSPTNFMIENADASFYTDMISVAEGQTVDFTHGTLRPNRAATLRAVNAPQPVSSIASNAQFLITDRDFSLGGSPITNVPIIDGTGEHTAMIADLPNVKISSIWNIETAAGTISMLRHAAATAMTELDFAQAGVAFLHQSTYANNTLSWTEQGTGGDFVTGVVQIVNGSSVRLLISIAGPKAGATLRVPVFPPPYDDHNAKPSDAPLNINTSIMRVSGGWDAARPFVYRADFQSYEWVDGDLSISH